MRCGDILKNEILVMRGGDPELPECVMLYFQSEPYDDPDDFSKYIGQVFRAIDNYDFERYGYVQARDIAPSLNLGADTKTGARVAVPVVKK